MDSELHDPTKAPAERRDEDEATARTGERDESREHAGDASIRNQALLYKETGGAVGRPGYTSASGGTLYGQTGGMLGRPRTPSPLVQRMLRETPSGSAAVQRAEAEGAAVEKAEEHEDDGAAGDEQAEEATAEAEAESPEEVREIAAEGVAGAGGPLPHLDKIQAAFGGHDVSGVKAHVGGEAAEAADAIGAEAFATGKDIAFKGAPDLHTAAHEAAHTVQQQQGVQLKGGVGEAGDAHEQQADAAADGVVRGESVEHLLGPVTQTRRGGGDYVQQKSSKSSKKSKAKKSKPAAPAPKSPEAEIANAETTRAIRSLGTEIDKADGVLLVPATVTSPAVMQTQLRQLQTVGDATTLVAALVADRGGLLDAATWRLVNEAGDRLRGLHARAAARLTTHSLAIAHVELVRAVERHGRSMSPIDDRAELAPLTSDEHGQVMDSIVRLVEERSSAIDAHLDKPTQAAELASHAHVLTALARQARHHLHGAAGRGSKPIIYEPHVARIDQAVKKLFGWGTTSGADLRGSGLEAAFDEVDGLWLAVGQNPKNRAATYYSGRTEDPAGVPKGKDETPGEAKTGETLLSEIKDAWSAMEEIPRNAITDVKERVRSAPKPASPDLLERLVAWFAGTLVDTLTASLAGSLKDFVSAVSKTDDLRVVAEPIRNVASELTASTGKDLKKAALGKIDTEPGGGKIDHEKIFITFFERAGEQLIDKIIAMKNGWHPTEAMLLRAPPTARRVFLENLKGETARSQARAQAEVAIQWQNFCAAARHGTDEGDPNRIDVSSDRRSGESVADWVDRGKLDHALRVNVYVDSSGNVQVRSATIGGTTEAALEPIQKANLPLAEVPLQRIITVEAPSRVGPLAMGRIYVDTTHQADVSGISNRAYFARLGRGQAFRVAEDSVVRDAEKSENARASDDDVLAGARWILANLAATTGIIK